MTRINGAADIATFIRRQMATMGAPGTRADGAGPGTAKAGGQAAPQDLASLVFRRIRFIDPADPDRRRKAFRVFIESVLLFELGEELINDPKFYELVDTVQGRMAADPALARAMDDASGMLVSMTER